MHSLSQVFTIFVVSCHNRNYFLKRSYVPKIFSCPCILLKCLRYILVYLRMREFKHRTNVRMWIRIYSSISAGLKYVVYIEYFRSLVQTKPMFTFLTLGQTKQCLPFLILVQTKYISIILNLAQRKSMAAFLTII